MSKSATGLTHDEFVAEAQALVADLAFFGRRAIRLKLVGGKHIAYTYNTEDDKHPIDIVLNPNCVEGVRTKARARSIIRGIGLHELLHHLHPAEEQYKTAYKEGFKDLFNLIDDEQNERRGRSHDPSWGAHFQTVCAHIFPFANLKEKSKLVVGIVDGEEQKKEEEPAANSLADNEVYCQRWNEFAIRLRRHFPKQGEDHVARALALIPANFMDLSKEDLLKLTRNVQAILAEGLELPVRRKTVKAEKAEEPEEDTPPPVAEGGIAPGLPFWKTLFKSKWSYIGLAVTALVIAALFSRGGVDRWFIVAEIVFFVVVGVGLSSVGLWRLKKWLDEQAEKNKGRLREPTQSKLWRRFKRACAKIMHKLVDLLGENTVGLLVRFVRLSIWSAIWRGIKAFFRAIGRGYKRCKYWCRYMWSQRWVRILVISFPAAFFLVLCWAVIMKAGEIHWWLTVLAGLGLLLLLLLSWIFRRKIWQFLMGELFVDVEMEASFSCTPPMDLESIEFNQITDIEQVEPDREFLAWALPIVQPLALALRETLSRVGCVSRDKDNEPVGHDVIDDIEQMYMGESNLMVDDEKLPAASLHIEVGVDCSGSMMSANETLKAGEKFKLAKLFALLIEEATRDLRGVSAHFWGFTDAMLYDCGLPGQYRTSGLASTGGNNDSAMLWHMGQSATASNKSVKMLFMLSDGQPSDCSWGSLRNLVLHFEGAGMVPWHFALDKIENSAFERYFTDLCGQPLEVAIVTMLGILSAIAQEQRG